LPHNAINGLRPLRAPSRWPRYHNDAWREGIKQESLHAALGITDFHAMVKEVVRLYADAIAVLAQRVPRPDVVLCCISKEIVDAAVEKKDRYGTVKPLKVSKKVQRLRERIQDDKESGQLSLF
jgi:hypothetical protein